MGFRGRDFAFDSPSAAVAGLIARIRPDPALLRPQLADLAARDGAHPAGRILAQDVRADRDSPPFDHAAMDGYAACAATLGGAAANAQAPLVIPVTGESRIGQEPPPLTGGLSAVRIATGAPMPRHADAVIRREDVVEHAHAREHADGSLDPPEVRAIEVHPLVAARAAPGQHVRRRGENAPAGALVLHAGDIISASALATLAAAGVTRPRIHAPLRIAIITTGEELVAPEESPSDFQIRNSNAPALHAILSSQPWLHVASCTHAPDDPSLDRQLPAARDQADAIVLSGGVSMGHRDPVRAAVEALGAEIIFHGLPQRPGKPMLGAALRPARDARPIPLFGLPGNPVSALVTCTRIVLPVLAACAGARRTPTSCLPLLARLANPDGQTLEVWWHRLVRLVPDAAGMPAAELIDARGSGDITAAGQSDGFVELPPAAAPTLVPFYPWPAGGTRP